MEDPTPTMIKGSVFTMPSLIDRIEAKIDAPFYSSFAKR